MGLDMYLYQNGKEVMYWRKAYQFHEFFTRNWLGDDNCQNIPVSHYKLLELKDICGKILNKIKNENIEEILSDDFKITPENEESVEACIESFKGYCLELLPCCYVDLIDWYVSGIKETYDFLENLMKQNDWEDCEYIYYAWY